MSTGVGTVRPRPDLFRPGDAVRVAHPVHTDSGKDGLEGVVTRRAASEGHWYVRPNPVASAGLWAPGRGPGVAPLVDVLVWHASLELTDPAEWERRIEEAKR